MSENKANKILFVGSEATPFAATGGLGDVLGSLPAALKRERGENIDIRVVIPMYGSISDDDRINFEKVCEFTVNLSWRQQYCGVYKCERNGVIYYFIDNEFYFKRSSMYGSFDDGERYAFFCKAVLEMMPHIGFFPDILHAHDWQSALSVIYLKRKYRYFEEYSHMKAIYTIHNIEYQGIYGFEILSDIFCLDSWDRYIVEYDGCINLTKGAIVCCDRLTTVSPNYANEIQTEYFSHGLHYIIAMNRDKITGIVNGIDYDNYNPEKDTELKRHFSSDNQIQKNVDKAELQNMFSLPERRDVPVIAMISRLASHKGFDLVKRVLEEIVTCDDVQFVLLGTGERDLEDYFSYMANKYPDRVGVKLAFNKTLAKQIYAGADIFLMPSKSEPCGLAQMIASRYGTVPVVRETGGLYDTIKPYNPEDKTGNGITFKTYNAHDMYDAVRRAIELFKNKRQWKTLRTNAMNTDFSWNSSAIKYLEMYDNL
ncbi:MAG: glycogen synthase GlgA [Ruminococcaceae bacterium]|nr:glycogen synthase GlgA [Oscillospiraceae bacterium]